MVPTIDFLGIPVTNPFIIPGALLGMIVGFYNFANIKPVLGNISTLSYLMLFLLFGLMNFSAIFADCLFPSNWTVGVPGNTVDIVCGFIDAFLSSMVDYSFILCGLSDIGVLNSVSNYVFALEIGVVGIATGYLLAIYGAWPAGFTYLYSYLALVGMLVFAACAVYLTYTMKRMETLTSVGLAMFCGLLGFWILSHEDEFCTRNPFLNSYVLWFLLSDAALALIGLYYVDSRPKIERYRAMYFI
jgi:hypothetical protein